MERILEEMVSLIALYEIQPLTIKMRKKWQKNVIPIIIINGGRKMRVNNNDDKRTVRKVQRQRRL